MSVFGATHPNSFLKLASLVLCMIGIVTLSACDAVSNQLKYDREANIEFQDVRDGLASRVDQEDPDDRKAKSSSIPKLQPYVAQSEYSHEAMPLVSISVNQTVPLRDVLYELAQQADYDIELDPRIQGSIIFTARQRPFDQVIERISEIAGLRYQMNDGTLRVELDLPYQKTYKIDYLSFIRKSNSEISNDISVVSGDGTDTGSNFTASSESENDFWTELTTGLEQILSAAPIGNLRTSADPQITALDQNPNVQSIAPPADANGNVVVQPPDAVLRVSSLPVTPVAGGQGSGGSGSGEGSGFTYSVNKQAGLISVYAPESVQKKVRDYLVLLRRAVTSQVLIEAKILQITLDDIHQTGIDWRLLNQHLAGPLDLQFFDQVSDLAVFDDTGFSNADGQQGVLLGVSGADFQAVIRALQGFGSVRALASPRMSVLNNQPAVLNVATNEVFFELEVNNTYDDTTGDVSETTLDSTIKNVPVGVLINVQPSIDLDNRTISMSVRPTITEVSSRKEDPAVVFAAEQAGISTDNISAEIPELNVQEIDTVVNMHSGQAIVMGGLLQDRYAVDDSGIPVLAEMPVVGNLFKKHDDAISKTELVIFLKATILDNPGQSIHDTDKDLYRKFSSDRRPFRF